MKVKLNELKLLVSQALAHQGYEPQQAATIAEVLLYAQLRGNNQGVVKLIGPGIPNAADGDIEVVRESKATALLDAHQNHAMVAVNRAVDLAAQKAKDCGIAVVGVNGVATSSGALGFYARKIARQGLVGIIFTSASGTVAAAGSYEPIFGTNPLAIAVPTTGEPLVLDMATAAMAWFGVMEAKTAGRKLPEEAAYDKNGQPTTEPDGILDGGALRTFGGGHKSSHLSMMIQILAGPLVGAAFMGEGDMKKNWAGQLVLAIDPEVLGGTEVLKQHVTTMIKKIKATKRLPGVDEISMPGERGDRQASEAETSGELEIEDNLYAELEQASIEKA